MTDDASKGWDQFTIIVDDKDASAISDALIEMGALGLHIEDDQTQTVPEKTTSDTKRSKIVASFASSVNNSIEVQSLINDLFSRLGITDTAICAFEHIPEQDYAKQFQQSWKAFRIGEKIWIVPSWEEESFHCDDPEAIIIHIDPELAFGTGQHETTRLCCDSMLNAVRESPNPEQLTILDVGTGTGILAFAGVLAGAKEAVGTDIDPEAIMVARANAIKNHLDSKVTFSDKNPDELDRQFDIVVANILALPLIQLAPRIVAAIKPGGRLFLSGLLIDQADAVAKAYVALGLTNGKPTHMNEWAMLSLLKV